MTVLSMLFVLLAGTVVQSILPAFAWAGHATVPVLAAVVIYYALYRGATLMMVVAIAAGIFQDSLSLMPLGYSSFCFAAGALLIRRYRDVMVINSALTNGVLAAGLHAASTIFISLMLLKDGMIPWHPGWLLLKIPGALLLGAMAGPLVVSLVSMFEEKLGLIQGNSENYGAQRSYYGIG